MRIASLTLLFIALPLAAQEYFPAPGSWQTKPAAELGFDKLKLQAAVEYAQAHGSDWDFPRDQVRTFGRPLGPVPEKRAATNGLIIRHGYIAATFGDVKAVDPIYSAAKSFLSTICSLAVAQGLIKDVNDPVARYIHDGSYASPHNARVTWKNHLQQESEWEGTMFGKPSTFLGIEEFGGGRRESRAIQDPGAFYEYNDVRVNRFSLNLMQLFGKPVPEVLKTKIMDPIGASNAWRWIPYANSNGSVSGGTRWGGGIWSNSEDLARFGLLILNHGRWKDRQLVSEQWLKDATQASAHGPDYGYLWWLNTKGKQWPSAPKSSFAAIGNGSNIIWIDPEHDLVIVWRWHGPFMDGVIQRTLAAILDK
jgi:CubicO group peptidase (beta-lactamase class C family)